MKIYELFEDVEQDIKDNTPSIIYKYRTWEDDFHKKIITEHEVWFAHPHKLNDPFDVRPPYNFISDGINWEEARVKIKNAGRAIDQHLSEEQLELEVEKRLFEMKKDPLAYFQKSKSNYLTDPTHYDNIGVFSCCASCLNEAMWAHYGNNHNGFAIGFDTVELARSLHGVFGFVDYSDTPIDYHIMGNNENLFKTEIFQKSTKWQNEEELRFITAGIGITQNRAKKYPSSVAKEIIFGLTTSKKVQNEVMEIAKDLLPNITFHQVEVRVDQFGFRKKQIG